MAFACQSNLCFNDTGNQSTCKQSCSQYQLWSIFYIQWHFYWCHTRRNCTSSAIVCFDDIATLSNSSNKLQVFDSKLLRIICLENTFCFFDTSDILYTHRQTTLSGIILRVIFLNLNNFYIKAQKCLSTYSREVQTAIADDDYPLQWAHGCGCSRINF